MNVLVNHQQLNSALRVVEKMVSRNVSLPILNTVLLKTENGRLRLSATNLEMGINYWLSAKINQEGEIAVPARVFSDFIGNIYDEKVNISAAKNIVAINSENYQTQILGMETRDFPLIPKMRNAIQFKIQSASLKEAIAGVFESSALSETRPEISGIFVNIQKNKAEFAATDSFRLAEKIIDLEEGIEKSIILPRGAALELLRIAESSGEVLTVAISDNQIFVLGADFEFISRLIDGRYPEYKRIIPEKFVSLARVNKNEFERNIRLASVFSSSISDIKLKAEKNVIQLTARNSDRGEIAATLPCVLKDLPFENAVNYNYLLDGLKIIPTENVIMQFTGDGSPLVLRGEERKDHTYLIMPLRA